MMNDEPLMDAVVQAVLFLELSDEQTVNEDAAVDMIEQIAATLQMLDASTKERFLQYIRRRAERTESGMKRQTIENLAANLGLISE